MDRTLFFDTADYPDRLRSLPSPPPSLAVAGGSLTARTAVAIVGSREPAAGAEAFTHDLAASLARAGAVVVSGGAVGIDAAAHRGALAAGGRTWAVAPSGRLHCFPKEHAELYAQIAESAGCMVWPFADAIAPLPGNFLRRNGVLVALADAVVIVQAGLPSGTLSAFAWAGKLGKPVWAVPGPPWDPSFAGCRAALDAGARPLASANALLDDLGLTFGSLALPFPSSTPPAAHGLQPTLATPEAKALWEACSTEARHVDEIAILAGLCASRAVTGLLTLALENVLVEGPDGFFRRGNAS